MEEKEEDKMLRKILWAFGIKMCLTFAVYWTVFIVPDQTAGMLWGQGLLMLVWLVPRFRLQVATVRFDVGAVALRWNLA